MSLPVEAELAQDQFAAEFFSLVESESWKELDEFTKKVEGSDWSYLIPKFLREMSHAEREEFSSYLQTL